MSSLIDFLNRLLAPRPAVAGDDAHECIAERVLNAGGGNPYHDKEGKFTSGSGAGGSGAKAKKPTTRELNAAASKASSDSTNADEESTSVDHLYASFGHLYAASSLRHAALLHEAAGKYGEGEKLREKAREHSDKAGAAGREPGQPVHPEDSKLMYQSGVAAAKGNMAGQKRRSSRAPGGSGAGASIGQLARQASEESRNASWFKTSDPEAAHAHAADLHEKAAAHGSAAAGEHRQAAAMHAEVAGRYRAAREAVDATKRVASVVSGIANDASEDAAVEKSPQAHARAASLHHDASIAHDNAHEAALIAGHDPSAHRAAARDHLEKARAHDKHRSS